MNSFRDRLKDLWARGLFNRYKSWDRERHRVPIDAFEEIDISQLLADIPIIPALPIRKRFVDRFKPEDVAQVRSANIDVLFRFGFRIIRGEILSSAKYGVWSFHHGDNREYRGSAPGFWELYEGNPATGTILQVLTESLDAGRVIYRSWSATDHGSLYATVNPMYWKTADFAMRRLRDLHRYGWDYPRSLPEFNEPDTYTKSVYHAPATPVMVRFLAKQLGRKLYDRARGVFFAERRKWFLAYRHRAARRSVLNDYNDFHIIAQPQDRFYADPFLFQRDSRTYLFFENFVCINNRANISYMELGNEGPLTPPSVALEKDYHLSYPFLFEFRGQVYMIPETKEKRTVELYRATKFPQEWVCERILIENVLAVDSTIYRRHGKFWLFANIAVPGASAHDELHLFFADSLEGHWTPHPKNPIISDVRRSRPAGALFIENGKLIRPSQDCSVRYGAAINFNEVEILSESDYRENLRGRLEPIWSKGIICTHTYSQSTDFEVLDGMSMKRQLMLLPSTRRKFKNR